MSNVSSQKAVRERHVPTKVSGIYYSARANGAKVFECRYTGSDGKRRYEACGTMEAAKKRLAELTHRVDRGEVVVNTTATFSDVLDGWREWRKLKPRTVENYERHLRAHIVDTFGRKRIKDITRASVRAWLNGMNRKDGRGALSESKRLRRLMNLRERIEADGLFFDSGIVSHGFAPYLRDYDIVIDVPAALPPGIPIGDTTGSYIMGRYRYRFTHCPEVRVTTTVPDDTWRDSWDDLFIDYAAWEAAGHPRGFVWGVNFADAYPGLSYIADSPAASQWSERLGHEMHEVMIETGTFVLRLVAHDLRVEQLAVGDPVTRELKPLA